MGMTDDSRIRQNDNFFSPQYDYLVSFFTNLSYIFLSVMVALMTGVFPRHSVKYLFAQTAPMFT